MNESYIITPTNDDIKHHGILGQKWGHRYGPPYPLGSGDHSSAENKAGWKKSINVGPVRTVKSPTHMIGRTVGKAAKTVGKKALKSAKVVGKKAAGATKNYLDDKTKDVRNQMKTREAIRRNIKQKEYAIRNQQYQQKMEAKLNRKYGLNKVTKTNDTGAPGKAKEIAKIAAKTALMLNPAVSPLIKGAVALKSYDKSLGRTKAIDRHKMSDEELVYRVGRLERENRLKTLESQNVDAGRDIISKVGTKVAATALTGATLYAGKAIISKNFSAEELGKAVFKGGAGKKD